MCSREIAVYQQSLAAHRVQWVNAASCSTSELGDGLTREAAMARLHLRRADGSLVSGAQAFAALWQQLPGWSILALPLRFAPVLWLAERVYVFFLVVRRSWRSA